MADHLTEEEQIETIKRWWSENWLSLVVPILLAICAYTGWNFWSDHKQEQSYLASDRYQELVTVLEEAGPQPSEEQRNTALSLASEIKNDFSGGLYADLSALILAKLYVDEKNYEQAASSLRTVSESGSTDSIKEIANGRLARVLLAQKQYDDALALVLSTESESAKAQYAEIRGDIYLEQGKLDAANTAYQEAISSLTGAQASHRGILQFKLDGTNVAMDSESSKPSAVEQNGGESAEPSADAEVEAADTTAS